MRTSSDFFDKLPDRFEVLETPFIPRDTVPFLVDKLTSKKTLPPIPKVHYPVFNRPPTPQKTALEKVQQEIQKEVLDLQQKKPSLDQLIQNALKQKIQSEKQKQTKVVTIPKVTPPTSRQPVKLHPLKPTVSSTKPFQKPTQDLWWPSEQEIITEKLHQAKLTKQPTTTIPVVDKVTSSPLNAGLNQKPWPSAMAPTPVIATPPPVIKTTPPSLPPAPITLPTGTKLIRSGSSPTQVFKSVFHVSTNIINYFLFTINMESDPFNDKTRQLIIYGIKTGAYLTTLTGIFELTRNLKIGLSLNGVLEVGSIFLISAILFFFGENLNILFKPISPYQVHEVV